ncbi:MAG: ABC transporter substrate-binding protein [Proteobacteria bacterium]|nr:ABC transporter substrate-binding protein [Pseudomonadota bacterium]
MLAAAATFVFASTETFAQALEIKIGYLHRPASKDRISLLDIPARDDGLAGAALGNEDNATTGRFTGQTFTLVSRSISDVSEIGPALSALADDGVSAVLVDGDAAGVLAAADAAKSRGLAVLNIAAPDDDLRGVQCSVNLIHVAPSRAMLADALGQYLALKNWKRWFLMVGTNPGDQALGAAFERAAKRFGAKIVEKREFKDTGGARRTDSGLVQAQQMMAGATQGANDHDVLVAADESDVFAGYLPYRTWSPRPVGGSAGLIPTGWDPSFDQWGGLQLQNRFVRKARRLMTALDYQAWVAVRMIGEAATRTKSNDPAALAAFLKSPDFSIAAFKGQKLTLRDWDGQLRQPVLLFDGKNTVSVSPQSGYLHPVTTLDTLGYDRPETQCKF